MEGDSKLNKLIELLDDKSYMVKEVALLAISNYKGEIDENNTEIIRKELIELSEIDSYGIKVAIGRVTSRVLAR